MFWRQVVSQSPVDPTNIAAANDPERPYRKAIIEVGEIIDQGGSLSGNERNCAFLNTGGGRFATVSAITGLDASDDARSPAPVDWDGDGDLDLWVANRSAPMLRFHENRSAASKGWLAFRLRGTKSNRDGIGARVTVTTRTGVTRSKTLKAGEGFLSNGSKWLHFGLGAKSEIAEVTVHWPGGKAETIKGAVAGLRCTITEGSGTAEPLPSTETVSYPSQEAPSESPAASYAVRAGSLTAIPTLPFETPEGTDGTIQFDGTPLLVNLWASWCAPCVEELTTFAKDADRLRKSGMKIIALGVDGRDKAAPIIAKTGFPFSWGTTTEETLRRLQLVHRMSFGVKREFPIPTSILITGDGRIAAWYFGPVAVDRLLADLKAVQTINAEDYADAALPFKGIWFKKPKPLNSLALAIDLMKDGHVDATDEFVRRSAPWMEKNREFAKLRVWLGDELMKRKDPDATNTAFGHFRAALALEPDNMLVLNNLAWQLAANEDQTVRNGAEAVRWAEKAAVNTGHKNPAVLDTLAAAYAQAGDFEKAVATSRQAMALARAKGDRALYEGIARGLRYYESKRPYGTE